MHHKSRTFKPGRFTCVVASGLAFFSTSGGLRAEDPTQFCWDLIGAHCCDGTNFTCFAICAGSGCCSAAVRSNRNDPVNYLTKTNPGYDWYDTDTTSADKQCWYYFSYCHPQYGCSINFQLEGSWTCFDWKINEGAQRNCRLSEGP